jgi:DNA-binding transcriptional MerR regulator
MTIGEFSRLVGVTPSALRYYDDCGLLVPAEIDPRTGYRLYTHGQRRRAEAIRLLRDAGLALADVRRAVDTPEVAPQVIAEHGARIAARAHAATASLGAAARLLAPRAAPATVVSVSGPQLASGIRQVTPAAAGPGGHEMLSGVLVEIDRDEVRLVASDGFRLAIRALPVLRFEGDPLRATVATAALRQLMPGLLQADVVDLGSGPSGLSCVMDDGDRPLEVRDGAFPDYRTMLAQWLRADARLVVDRAALHGALEAVRHEPVCIGPAAAGTVRVAVAGSPGVTMPCAWRGPSFGTWFDAAHLADALTASVGPDVIIELADAALPAVVRSADHGSFTTVVMPRLERGPDGDPMEDADGSRQPGGAAVCAGDGG